MGKIWGSLLWATCARRWPSASEGHPSHTRTRASSHGWSPDARRRWWWCEGNRQGVCALLRGKYILALGVRRVNCASGVLVARIFHKCTNRDVVRSSTYERRTQFVCCRLQMTGFETPSAGGDARLGFHTPGMGGATPSEDTPPTFDARYIPRTGSSVGTDRHGYVVVL